MIPDLIQEQITIQDLDLNQERIRAQARERCKTPDLGLRMTQAQLNLTQDKTQGPNKWLPASLSAPVAWSTQSLATVVTLLSTVTENQSQLWPTAHLMNANKEVHAQKHRS